VQGFQGPQGNQGPGFSIGTSGDDRVLTSDGTSTGANAETNLKFNASTNILDVDGTIKFKKTSEVYNALGISGGTLTINLDNGTVFSVNVTANITNISITGTIPTATGFTLVTIGDGTARTITWGAIKWAGGTPPTYTSTPVNAQDVYSFFTYDGGTNWFGFVGGQNF
jgi:hypothetical protein